MLKNKKILVINTYFSPIGGAEIIAYDTYQLLKQHGFDTYFWACDKEPYFEHDYEYRSCFTKYNASIFNYYSWYYNCRAKEDLAKFIEKIKPNLIHVHGFISYLSPSVLECFGDIPTVATLHDLSIVCPAVKFMFQNKKFCDGFNCRNGNYINCLLNNCTNNFESSIRKTLRAYLVKNGLKNINHYISPSNALKELVVKSDIGIDEKDITTVNNFLPNIDINNKPNYKNKGYFLYVGRLSREKGVHYLLNAMKDLPKEIEVHIVGKGPEEEFLKQYAMSNSLENVKFLGFKNRVEVNDEYQNCIATILPCNWFENFPTTNMESFINGKPIIASNIGGIPEQVEHNKTGLLFNPTNVEELKDCIYKYWNNTMLSVEHGKAAYFKAVNLYTADNYFNNISNIYAKLLARSEY